MSALHRLSAFTTRIPRVHVSGPGLLLGALCFAAALTPSLIPRAGLVQGLLAGASFVAGYGVAVAGHLLWHLLELPQWRGPRAWRLAGVVALAVMIRALWRAAEWQDMLRAAMDLPPVETVRPFTIAATALATAALLICLARLFRRAGLALARHLARILPERLALVLGFLLAVAVFGALGNDLILRRALAAFDASYRAMDAALTEAPDPPADPLKTGSAASLIGWEGIGAEGRNRIADPLDAAAIAAITGRPALAPLRVYVGLGSAETPQARAALALAEAIRIGAFARGTLVIATPTGTGWLDPAAMMPLEVLTDGDVATISVQYSYLPSWLSLLTVPEYGARTAREVFEAIHGHWRRLPADSRPRLYLFGLSLGALNSDLSADFYDLIGDPYQGALWVGAPFASRSWARITADRQPDSPAWLPRFRDGAAVRFLNQTDMPDAGLPWGPMRLVYLQYASDPITFFSPAILWRRPEWMTGPRGPGVIEAFRWLPLVTFLQVGFDLFTGTTAPRGHGHVYAGQDYLRGWLALLSPEGWDEAGLSRLRMALTARGL